MSSDAPTTPIPPAQEATGGELSRLIRVFTQPATVFGELAASPTWLAALVVIVLLATGMQFVIGPRLDMQGTIRQSMAENSSSQKMSEEQLDKFASAGAKTATVMRWLTPAMVVGMFVILGGVYMLGLKAVGSNAEFKPVLATVLHANLPGSIVSSALLLAVVLKRASFTAQELGRMVKSNLGAFLPESVPKPLAALAGVVDVFNLWQWVLLAVGLSIVGRVSRGKAIAVVAVVWGVWALGKMGMALL
jgi:hypothetical protein